MIPYAATTGTAPNSSYVYPFGQAVSRTTYANLFALTSTTYGVGDGSTTFNLPDLRGRVVAGYDSMGGPSANRLTGLSGGVNGDTLGGTGGSESHTLTSGQLPANIPNTATTSTVTTTTPDQSIGADGLANGNWGTGGASRTVQQIKLAAGTLDTLNPTYSSASASSTSVTINAAGGAAHNNVQPTIIIPWLIRVL
jgi:microcystin-dependent protein